MLSSLRATIFAILEERVNPCAYDRNKLQISHAERVRGLNSSATISVVSKEAQSSVREHPWGKELILFKLRNSSLSMTLLSFGRDRIFGHSEPTLPRGLDEFCHTYLDFVYILT
jgi:hypothetical protein